METGKEEDVELEVLVFICDRGTSFLEVDNSPIINSSPTVFNCMKWSDDGSE
jgi:hypothetical protein